MNAPRRTSLLAVAAVAAASMAATGQSRAGQQAKSASKAVISYFPFYRTNLRQIPLERLTQIVYAFVEYGPDGRVRPKDFDKDFAANVAYLTSRRARLPGLKVVLGFGGAGDWSSYFAKVTAPATRDAAAKDAVAFMEKNGFDGIDIDWESPKPGTAEPQNFVDYMAALRRELERVTARTHRHYTLSAAVAYLAEDPYNEQGKLETPPAAAASVDFWNVMAYSMRGPWNCSEGGGGAGHQAALRPMAGDPYVRNGGAVAVAAWKRLGVPANKIVLGIPFYGTLFEGVEPGPKGDGLRQHCTGSRSNQIDAPEASKLNAAAGFVDYYDTRSEAAYRYSARQKSFLSYETPRSIAAKRRYARAQGLAGVMSWDLGSDDSGFTLLKALSR